MNGSLIAATQSRFGQQGMTMVVSLIFLLALTLIGVSAMRGVVVEEKMASNMEKLTTALQAAETGVVHATRDLTLFNTSAPSTGSTGVIGSGDASADFTVSYQGRTKPARMQNGWGASSANSHHFDIQSEGKSSIKSGVTLHQGVHVLGPSGEGG